MTIGININIGIYPSILLITYIFCLPHPTAGTMNPISRLSEGEREEMEWKEQEERERETAIIIRRVDKVSSLIRLSDDPSVIFDTLTRRKSKDTDWE